MTDRETTAAEQLTTRAAKSLDAMRAAITRADVGGADGEVTIGGTVRANRDIDFVEVTGYANDQRLFFTDSLGFMDKGDVETFTITGRITTSSTELQCRAEVSFSS